jgi:LuxR family transcriptional regulator, maltose regulon positive regulatory protein
MSSDRIAKLSSPKVKNTVRRRGCYAVLESARDKPAVWVSAPAGAGKTALVAGFRQERGHPCLWYQMDAEDTDPAVFFHFLGVAFQTARHSDKPLPLLTPECAPVNQR